MPDWDKTLIEVENIKQWLRLKGRAVGFFFADDEVQEDELMNPKHSHFAPELALAVSAWRALASKKNLKQSAKNMIDDWIKGNPASWKGEGKLSTAAKERIMVVSNWNKSGGSPSSADD